MVLPSCSRSETTRDNERGRKTERKREGKAQTLKIQARRRQKKKKREREREREKKQKIKVTHTKKRHYITERHQYLPLLHPNTLIYYLFVFAIGKKGNIRRKEQRREQLKTAAITFEQLITSFATSFSTKTY